MKQQLTVPIVSHTKLSPGYYVLGLKAPSIASTAQPGQFVMLRLSNTNLLWSRAYSIYHVEGETLYLLYKVIGRQTQLLCQKKAGETVQLIGPLGNTFTPPKKEDISFLVGGGVGLPPLYAYAKTYIKKSPQMRVFIGARDKQNVLLEKEFKALGCQVEVTTEDGSYGLKGLVTDILKNSIRNNLKMRDRLKIYSCGPNLMLKAVGEIGLQNKIQTELSLEEQMACGLGVCLGCVVKTKSAAEEAPGYTKLCSEGPVLRAEKVVWEKC